MKNYSNLTADFLKERIKEIEDLINFNKKKRKNTAGPEMEQDLFELKEALAIKENEMIEVVVTGPHGLSAPKFVAQDETGKIWYKAKRKSDLKTSVRRSKYDIVLVEKFTVIEKPKADKKPKATPKKKSDNYEDRKLYIISKFGDVDLYSKSPKIVAFCKKFNLTPTKAGRNLTFEKTLEKMVEEGVIEYVPAKEGAKYKKLDFQYTEDHSKAMSPDEEEL